MRGFYVAPMELLFLCGLLFFYQQFVPTELKTKEKFFLGCLNCCDETGTMQTKPDRKEKPALTKYSLRREVCRNELGMTLRGVARLWDEGGRGGG